MSSNSERLSKRWPNSSATTEDGPSPLVRTVKRTAQFRRDFKRVKRGVYGGHLDATLLEALGHLAADVRLPPR